MYPRNPAVSGQEKRSKEGRARWVAWTARRVWIGRPCPLSRGRARLRICRGRTSVLAVCVCARVRLCVTTTIYVGSPMPGTRPRVSTLATPHAWLRSLLPSSAGPPPGSAAIRPRARARAGTPARTHAHAHARTHAHACSHVCSLLLPCLAFFPARSPGRILSFVRFNTPPLSTENVSLFGFHWRAGPVFLHG